MRCSILLLPFLALSGSASAQPVDASSSASADFRSIELRGGGLVTVRHGPERRVTVLRANPDRPIRTEGDRLVIDECRRPCPRGHRIEVEIVTPELSGLAVAHGGRILVVDGFDSQPALVVSVSNGGVIDARPLEATSVAAAIDNGGLIFARPGRSLTASISNGGNVTYWGSPSVTSSIDQGGVVERGDAADLGRTLAEIDARMAPPPVTAVVQAAPPRRPRKH